MTLLASGEGNILVPAAMFGWIPVVLALFALLRPRRAVIAAYIAAWLFLPMANYDVIGLPPYSKVTATGYGVLLGVFLFDSHRLFSFRPRLYDLPMLIWCVCPLATSISNNLGVYDGLSGVLSQIVEWGLPYLFGRLYFSDSEGLKELAIGLFIAGLIYVPFCLWELQMSPRLHKIIYGFRQHSFAQAMRGDGWRPMVFMQHGLAVAMFMTSATVVGFGLWKSRTVRSIYGIPILWLLVPLLLTSVVLKSMLAFLLLVIGLFTVWITQLVPTRVMVACLIGFAPMYMVARSVDTWSGDVLVELAGSLGSSDRAASVQTRLTSEKYLLKKAWVRPIFGWGGYGRGLYDERVETEEGKVKVIPDGFWIITFGARGLLGLGAVTLISLLPGSMLMWRLRSNQWRWPPAGPVLVFIVIMGLYMCDNLMNAMMNPIFIIAAGGLAGIAARIRPASRPMGPKRSRSNHTPESEIN